MKFIVLIFFLIGISYSLKENEIVRIEQGFKSIDVFGFLPGGTISISNVSALSQMDSLFTTSQSLWFLICSSNEYAILSGGFGSLSSPQNPCVQPNLLNSTCSISYRILNETLTITKEIEDYETYQFEVVYCGSKPLDVYFNYELYNPGPNYLSYSQIPLPFVFEVLMQCWILFAVWWMTQLFRFRPKVNKMFLLMMCAPMVKAGWCLSAFKHYQLLSETGEIFWNEFYIYASLYIADRCFLFGTLLLVASGYGTINSQLGRYKYYSSLVFFGIASSLILGIFVQQLFQMLRYIIYIIAVVLVFRSINQNLILLYMQQRNFSEPPPTTYDETNVYTIIENKMRMFSNYKNIMLTYISVVLFCVIFEVLFLYNYLWVEIIIRETQDFVLLLFVYWVFKPKASTQPFDLSTIEQQQPEEEEEEQVEDDE